MVLTPYHARYYAALLSQRWPGRSLERYLPALLSATIDLHPHQIDAALFASRSQFQKGVILADESGLGKTIEAGIVLLQTAIEGKNNLLVLCPANQLTHWQQELESKFGLMQVGLDTVGWESGVVILSYQSAYNQIGSLATIAWDLCVLDQAHTLANASLSEKAIADSLYSTLLGIPKLLLTASPMQNSLLDLYYLIRFIDETAWGGTPELFRQRYLQSDQLKEELQARAQLVCQRTLKSQALTMPQIKRVVRTIVVLPSEAEDSLSQLLSAYFHRPYLAAFPKIPEHRIRLVFWKLLASSPAALHDALQKPLKRLQNIQGAYNELQELTTIAETALNIKATARSQILLQTLPEVFSQLEQSKRPLKAVLFSENKATLAYLHQVLISHSYNSVVYKGESQLRAFRTNKGAQIMLTGNSAVGLDLSFCPLVINYDLPWNVQKLEERISCCHRYGQKHEVMVINFIDPANRAEKRLYKLLNRKLQMFDDVFGASHTVLGQIADSPLTNDEDEQSENIWPEPAKQAEIQQSLKKAQNDLLAHFDHEVQARFAGYGEKVAPAISQLDNMLWQIICYKLHNQATIFDDKRQLALKKSPYKDLHLNRTFFGMDKALPRGERLTLHHPLVRRVLRDCLDGDFSYGTIVLQAGDDFSSGMSGELGLWRIHCLSHLNYRTDLLLCSLSGQNILSHEQCVNLLQLKPISHSGAMNERECENKDSFRPASCSAKLAELAATGMAGLRQQMALQQGELLQERQKQLGQWADDEAAALQLPQQALLQQISQLQKQLKDSSDFAQRLSVNKRLVKLDRERISREEEILYQQAEVTQKQRTLTSRAVAEFSARFWEELMFVVNWQVK